MFKNNAIILIILIYLIINVYIYFYKNKRISHPTKNNNIQKKQIHPNYFIRYNSFNIYMDNIEDFFKSNNFILIPNQNSSNKCNNTYFFKQKYPKVSSDYNKYQEKNITLRLKYDNELQPSFFTNFQNRSREIFLKRLGFKLDNLIKVHNLYLGALNINIKIKHEIKKFIIDKYQKINMFFNCEEYTSKSLLYINYKKYKDKYPLDYDYMLETFSYPEQKDEIEARFKNYKLTNDNDIWMFKPKNSLCGHEISILTNFTDIKQKSYILTKYLYNPFLIKGYKFDLRFHGLITGVKPLKLYMYNEGLVRLASEKYNFSAENKFVFLTNLYINILNKNKFIYPQNLSNIEDSNLWNLEAFQKYCERNNINYHKLYNEVVDIFIKTMLSVRKKLIENVERNKLYFTNFYHLIGFDIILDENLKPYLLEMNKVCGFREDNDAEKYFTYNIFADTLNILGIIPNNMNSTKENRNDLLNEKLDETLCEFDRPRGGYELIFPLRKNVGRYKKFYGEDIPEEDKELLKHLIE